MGNIVTLQIEHVFKELNELDDGLSKATIEGDEGFLHIEEYIEDTLSIHWLLLFLAIVLWCCCGFYLFCFYVGMISLFLKS